MHFACSRPIATSARFSLRLCARYICLGACCWRMSTPCHLNLAQSRKESRMSVQIGPAIRNCEARKGFKVRYFASRSQTFDIVILSLNHIEGVPNPRVRPTQSQHHTMALWDAKPLELFGWRPRHPYYKNNRLVACYEG